MNIKVKFYWKVKFLVRKEVFFFISIFVYNLVLDRDGLWFSGLKMY